MVSSEQPRGHASHPSRNGKSRHWVKPGNSRPFRNVRFAMLEETFGLLPPMLLADFRLSRELAEQFGGRVLAVGRLAGNFI